jgi:hypothetical protein
MSAIFYEIWDQRSGNLLGSYGTEWEALAFVRDLAAASAPVDSLALVWGDEDDEERGSLIAEGQGLLTRARGARSSSA